MRLCYLDFEFNDISEPIRNLVCVAWEIYDNGEKVDDRAIWLYNDPKGQELAAELIRNEVALGTIFVAFVMEAESFCMQQLTKDKMIGAKYLDLYLEYRHLLNHNHKLQYGKQYIGGKIITTTPPPNKWDLRENGGDDEDSAHHKPEYSLAAATFKLLGKVIDADEKEEARGIIIRGDAKEIEGNRQRILDYCKSDISNLREMLIAIKKEYSSLGLKGFSWIRGALLRGSYARSTAQMTALGYPVNTDKLRKFVANSKEIMNASALATNQVAEKEGYKPFRWNKKELGYNMDTKEVKRFIASLDIPTWRKTPQGAYQISTDAFWDHFTDESEGFAGAFVRHLYTKKSLNGFLPQKAGSKKRNFFDYLGRDGRVRPMMGIYGSQASRSQPAATGFIPLKAHWMRNFIEAPEGKAICGIDYSSQEFLISAIMSQDKAMMAAYASGDVYTAFGKDANIIPKDGNKHTHKKERDFCKALVLGMSYDMTYKGMAPRLSREAKRTVTDDEAQKYIDLFYNTYSDFEDWKAEVQEEYRDTRKLQLADDWYMWRDNDNFRSVGNFPVQGAGAVIMREAVKLAQKHGLDVIYTLHDAIYIEYQSYEFDSVELLKKVMIVAFDKVMSRYGKTIAVRVEGETWSRDYLDCRESVPDVEILVEYVDGKGKSDLERYRPFFQ